MEKIKQFIESDRGRNISLVIIIILVGLASFQLGRLSVKRNTNQGVKVTYPSQAELQGASALDAVSAAAGSALVNNAARAAGIKSKASTTSQTTPKTTQASAKNFFASNRGHKYYSIGCSAGKTIKQENRIYFTTSSEAERAGYELSSSCK